LCLFILSVVDKVQTAVVADYGFGCILASVAVGYRMGILAVYGALLFEL